MSSGKLDEANNLKLNTSFKLLESTRKNWLISHILIHKSSGNVMTVNIIIESKYWNIFLYS